MFSTLNPSRSPTNSLSSILYAFFMTIVKLPILEEYNWLNIEIEAMWKVQVGHASEPLKDLLFLFHVVSMSVQVMLLVFIICN